MLIERVWRVTMADVDGAGILYYASPLRWAEMLLGDWLERCGHSLSSMFAANEAIPVVGVSVRYVAPLGLDDRCSLRLSVARIGKTSFTACCGVRRAGDGHSDERVAVEINSTHAYVRHLRQPRGGAELAKQPLPGWLRQALESDREPIGKGSESDSKGDDE